MTKLLNLADRTQHVTVYRRDPTELYNTDDVDIVE